MTKRTSIMLPRIFWGTFIFVTIIRVALATVSGLSDDEAYYWQWAMIPGLSYYDHPAMVAWLIKLSQAWLGDTPFGVRLPALLLNTASWWALVALARLMFSKTVGYITGILYLLLPIYSLGGIMMVPDSPMAFFWVLVLLLGWRILMEEGDNISWAAWTALGVLIGLGILSKYTMILVGGSLLLVFLSRANLRRAFLTPRPWWALSLVVILSLPILVWNAQQHWPSFYYHFYQRHSGGGGLSWQRWITFWVSQILLLTPVVFIALSLSAWRSLRHLSDLRWRYIAFMSLPTLALFEIQSLFAEFKPHWPAPAYLPLIIGAAALGEEIVQQASSSARRKMLFWILGMALFVIPINGFFWVATVKPIAPMLHELFEPAQPWNPKWDPTNDLYGQTEVAAHLKALRKGLREKMTANDESPIYISHRYQLCAPLSFQLATTVWCFSPQKDQYDFWQSPTRLNAILGTSAIFISDNRFRTDPRDILDFAQCTELEPLTIYRDHYLARVFYFWHCTNFRGQREN